ncbi:Homeodomain-like protein, partial [Lentinula raphanica]
WCNISRKVPNRSNKDCRKRWMSTHAGAETKITKGAWSEAEDDQLRAAVQVVGPRWCRVAEMVQGRNSDQCAKRWKDTLDPAIDRSKWSPREDELLLKVVGQTGRKWARVVKEHFPGRTGLAAKNR